VSTDRVGSSRQQLNRYLSHVSRPIRWILWESKEAGGMDPNRDRVLLKKTRGEIDRLDKG
jgi:hypothetical protein